MIITIVGTLFESIGWGLMLFWAIAGLTTILAIVNFVRKHGNVKPRAEVRHGKARK
jgi:hypothetical protein